MYLGHVVGRGEVRPMECKVQAVMKYAQPKTKKQVRTFLGLCGYHRHFIPSFSTIASPLTELTRKNKGNTVKWTAECEHAFNLLKVALTKQPVLTTPDWVRKFVLQTDASATGLGYVLSQGGSDGEEHPITYGSRKLLPREQRYSAIEREALAIVAGVKHFRTYFGGVSFQIETDNNPLTHLSTLRDSHGRLAHWALTLQPYRFKVVHRAGTANANALGLSRDQGSRLKEEGVSGEPLTMIESIQTPEVVNGKVQDVMSGIMEAHTCHKRIRGRSINILTEYVKAPDWLSRRLPWRGDDVYEKQLDIIKGSVRTVEEGSPR